LQKEKYLPILQLKCENCGEVTKKETCVILSETVPLSTGRESAHLIQKCKFCGREGNIKMIPGYGHPLTLEMSDAVEAAKLMLFECRGFEPVDFLFGDNWKAESIWGTKFDIDLSDSDFVEYDEKGESPVGISNTKAYFQVAQKSRGHVKYI